MKRPGVAIHGLLILTGLVLLPDTGLAQELRRIFKHRGVWVENIGACPTDMTDGIIDRFESRGRRIRLINVNPAAYEIEGNCRNKSVFLVYLNPGERIYSYPGFIRYIDRNGRFEPHSWGEVENLRFHLEDPHLRVIEFDRGSMYMTALNSHRVELAPGVRLTAANIDLIVEAVHSRYGPDIDRRIQSDVKLSRPEPGRITARFIDGKNKQRTYELQKTGRTWTVTGSPDDQPAGRRP